MILIFLSATGKHWKNSINSVQAQTLYKDISKSKELLIITTILFLIIFVNVTSNTKIIML